MSEVLWPYEETRFEFPDNNTVRLKTPWKSIDLKVSPDVKIELETLVLRRDEIPAANQRAYFSKHFASFAREPFFYFAARDERLPLAASHPLPKFRVMKSERAKMFESDVPAAICEKLNTRVWHGDLALPLARLRGSELYDATTLLTAFRRFHLEEKLKFDHTDRLREMIADIKDASLLDRAKRLVHEFQQDLDRRFELMSKGASPLRQDVITSKPLVNLMTETFDLLADQHVLCHACSIAFLDDGAFDRALRIAETLPPVSRAYAQGSLELSETMSKIFNLLGENLCYDVQNLINEHARISRAS